MPGFSYKKEIIPKLKPGPGQTIRPAGKRVYKVGDRLYHYTGAYKPGQRIKLGESTISEVVKIALSFNINNIDLGLYFWDDKPCWYAKHRADLVLLATADGFLTSKDFERFFIKTYEIKPGDWKEFYIIKWLDYVPSQI